MDPTISCLRSTRSPKKGRSGGVRVVWEVNHREVADVFKGLSRRLRVFFEIVLPGFPHPAAHGSVPGRSTRSNASRHLGASAVLKADIRNFFGSIETKRVVKLLEQAGLTPEGSAALASVLTRANHLPLGLHTSPVIANAICHQLDARLSMLCPGGMYTRYADDLTFSGPILPTENSVAAEVGRFGFELVPSKWRLLRKGRGLYVTGLSLEDGVRPRVPRTMKRRLRQDLYYSEKFGIADHSVRRGFVNPQPLVNRIHGTIQYVRGIEPEIGLKLHHAWTGTMQRQGYHVRYPSDDEVRVKSATFLLDETEILARGRTVLAVCLAVIEDAPRVRSATEKLREELTANPYGESVGRLHWVELSPDNRTKTTERVRALPLRCFIAYVEIARADRQSYSGTYERLFRQLLSDRMLKYDHCMVDITVEENSKLSLGSLQQIVDELYAELGDRKPAEVPVCRLVSKSADPALPVPDLILGVFREFARSKELAENDAAKGKRIPSGAQARGRYEQLRDKIRAIYDLDTGVVYSRHRPFEPF